MERLRDFLNFRSSNLNTTLIYGLMDNLYPCLKHTLSLSVFSTEFSDSGEILCKATFSMNAFNLLLIDGFLQKMFTLSLWKKLKNTYFRVIRIDLFITWKR